MIAHLCLDASLDNIMHPTKYLSHTVELNMACADTRTSVEAPCRSLTAPPGSECEDRLVAPESGPAWLCKCIKNLAVSL